MKISVEGADPHQASLLIVMLHGAGSSGLDFLALSQALKTKDDTSFLAPQALGRHWFESLPGDSRGLAEPQFTLSVLSVLGLLQNHSEQDTVLIGFADGAGVVAELLTHEELPRSVKAAWLASGGLVGLPEEWPDTTRCTVPILVSGLKREQENLEETARHFERRGAKVERSFQEGEEPGIGPEELDLAQKMITAVVS